MLKVCRLLTEYRRNPLGMDEKSPRFFYRLEGDDSKRQSARRIQVRCECGKIVWDSGFVESDENIQIVYKGDALKAHTRYFWQVKVKDENGTESDWSEEAFFETGFMGSPWHAKWICGKNDVSTQKPPQYLVRDFSLNGSVRKARLYITALGLYEAFVNGKAVTENCFTPGWTQYNKRVQYQVYDVTELLLKGDNALAVNVADGWFSGCIARNWNTGRPTYGEASMLRAELAVTLENGETFRLDSDKSWLCYHQGIPIRMSDIYMGETYDATYDDELWKQPCPPDKKRPFATAQVGEKEPDCEIVWQSGADVKRMLEISPVQITERSPGNYVVDFGQNLTGRERIILKNAPSGTGILIKHGEMLNPDGSVYRENLRSALATTLYICGGRETEVYEPHFTYYGFRYLEISGWPCKLTSDMISAQVIYSDLEETGKFSCSNPMLNQLYSNIIWGQRSNFVDVPTDCPQRDERQGWTGDTQVFANIASYNMFTPAFYTKWIKDLNLSLQNGSHCFPHFAPMPFWNTGWNEKPATGWADAGIICPWVMLSKYGDLRPFCDNIGNICHYLDWQIENAENSLIVKNACFGDWLNIDANTPEEYLSTAYLAGMNRLTAKMARLAGWLEMAEYREHLADQIRSAFGREFFTADGELKIKTQTAALLALHFRLCPENACEKTVEFLIHDIKVTRGLHLSTGFLGTPLLLNVLTKTGHEDLAYELLQQTTYPSWLYPVTQGATTMWERWNSWTKEKGFGDVGMNSFNHYAYGAVGEWFFETICGINPSAETVKTCAFKEFSLAPRFGTSLTEAAAEYDSLYGKISSAWKRNNGVVEWTFTVPCNTRAEIVFPVNDLKQVSGLESSGVVRENNGRIYAAPGTYSFTINL